MHGLPPVASGIDDRPEPSLRHTLAESHLPSDKHEFTQERLVFVRRVGEGGEMFLGDHEDVGRSLRPDIPKGEHALRFPDYVGGNTAIDDLAEEAVFVGHW